MKLADLIPDEGHLVVVTGCLTCAKFLMSHRDVEAVAHDYRSSTHPERCVVRLEADRTAGMAQGRWERGGLEALVEPTQGTRRPIRSREWMPTAMDASPARKHGAGFRNVSVRSIPMTMGFSRRLNWIDSSSQCPSAHAAGRVAAGRAAEHVGVRIHQEMTARSDRRRRSSASFIHW